MKPGNLRLQGAKSGGANRKMRQLFFDSLRIAERCFYLMDLFNPRLSIMKEL